MNANRATEQKLMHQWAEQMALVVVTRRNDVRVAFAQEGFGGDLLVSLLRDGEPTGNYLGIEVKASEKPLVVATVEAKRRLPSVPITPWVRHVSFPVCLFHFTAEDNQSYWKWLRQPVSGQLPALNLVEGALVEPLTRDAWDQILQAVRDWYEQRK